MRGVRPESIIVDDFAYTQKMDNHSPQLELDRVKKKMIFNSQYGLYYNEWQYLLNNTYSTIGDDTYIKTLYYKNTWKLNKVDNFVVEIKIPKMFQEPEKLKIKFEGE